MVNRNPLKCDACGTRIVTRTSIGHGDSQVHSFPCPTCGVGITYKVILDQQNSGIDYESGPENATWVGSVDGSEPEVTFDSELLLPNYALSTPALTPFIAAASFLRDIPTFQRHEAVRLHWRKQIWPETSRLPVHFQNENWDLFDAEAKKIGQEPAEDSAAARLDLLRHVYDLPFGWMLYPDSGRKSRVQQRIALARAKEGELVAQLAYDYLKSGRLAELWRQLQQFHQQFVRDFPYLSPVLQARIYWRDAEPDLTQCVVCDKRFPELKPLYIDAFETFARLSVVAIGFEAIIFHGRLAIPTRRRSLDLAAFEKLPTANKPNHLKNYPIDDLFSPYLETSLRNGIGHNAARYDAALDEVVCIQQDGGNLAEERVHYTVFCHRVLEAASALFHSEPYFFALLEEIGGRLGAAPNKALQVIG
ncbi:MAG: hypothetical protein ACQGVK_02745 [Myxococcota bacterium]